MTFKMKAARVAVMAIVSALFALGLACSGDEPLPSVSCPMDVSIGPSQGTQTVVYTMEGDLMVHCNNHVSVGDSAEEPSDGGAGGQGGAGGAAANQKPAGCADACLGSHVCELGACVDGACLLSKAPDGYVCGPSAVCVDGACKAVECVKWPDCKIAPGVECVTPVCTNFKCGTMPMPNGSICTGSGGPGMSVCVNGVCEPN